MPYSAGCPAFHFKHDPADPIVGGPKDQGEAAEKEIGPENLPALDFNRVGQPADAGVRLAFKGEGVGAGRCDGDPSPGLLSDDARVHQVTA